MPLTRREFSTLLGCSLAWPVITRASAPYPSSGFRMRTITAGVPLSNLSNLESVEKAIDFLRAARDVYVAQGIEVQTLRLATQPLSEYLPARNSPDGLQALANLDRLAVENEMVLSIGPVDPGEQGPQAFAEWAVELIRTTRNTSFTCPVTAADGAILERGILAAALAIHAIAHDTPGGEGNFRFAAAANIPPGTPFFPAAWFDKERTFSVGLESPNLLTQALGGGMDFFQAKAQLARVLGAAVAPVAATGQQLEKDSGWGYLGIDASPAPGLDASIGEAIEALTGTPFGSPATLAGCAAITDVLQSLQVKTCGYSGLMLPVLEDTVLARRAAEGGYGVSDLLLFSSVCGTGLDVVPLPGETSFDVLAAMVADVASLSAKYRKPLSARLFPVPGKKAGDAVSFDNPYLTDTVVMPAG